MEWVTVAWLMGTVGSVVGVFIAGYVLRGRLAKAHQALIESDLREQEQRLAHVRKALAAELEAAHVRSHGASLDRSKLEERLKILADPDPARRIRLLLELFPPATTGTTTATHESGDQADGGGSGPVADGPEA